jgi:hypothetical protein
MCQKYHKWEPRKLSGHNALNFRFLGFPSVIFFSVIVKKEKTGEDYPFLNGSSLDLKSRFKINPLLDVSGQILR